MAWKSGGSAAALASAALATAVAVAFTRRIATSSLTSRALASRVEAVPRRRPASVGDSLDAVETPCLIVDLDAMERNLRLMPQTLKNHPHVAIRPHGKAHKSAAIGLLQQQYSKAVGLCCQKVGEAEAMFAGGIHDLLLSNEIYGAERYARMAELVKRGANITLIFDNATAIAQAQAVALEHGVIFHALVDVNVGQNRCGVDTVEEAVALARQLDVASHRMLRGIQAYHGGAQHIRDYATKSDLILNHVCAKARRVRDAFRASELTCDVVTGGGTGTYLLEASSGVFTEVQPGSYLFNDADYARNLDASGQLTSQWQQSLFVLTTVMSVNSSAPRAVVDAGMKAVSLDSGPPLVHESSLVYQSRGDEHGILVPPSGAAVPVEMPTLGKKLLLVPGHCDPTANMYDFLVGVRGGVVESVWDIEARGPGN